MMPRLLIAAALLLTATPALADWGATKWGMTPEEVIAAVPQAVAIKAPAREQEVWDHQPLAAVGAGIKNVFTDIELTALFYFSHQRRLGFIKFEPVEMSHCSDLEQALHRSLGEGASETREIGVVLKATRWTNPLTRERLLFSDVRKTADSPPIRCHFIQQAPA